MPAAVVVGARIIQPSIAAFIFIVMLVFSVSIMSWSLTVIKLLPLVSTKISRPEFKKRDKRDKVVQEFPLSFDAYFTLGFSALSLNRFTI